MRVCQVIHREFLPGHKDAGPTVSSLGNVCSITAQIEHSSQLRCIESIIVGVEGGKKCIVLYSNVAWMDAIVERQ